jgi:hypothetical protein
MFNHTAPIPQEEEPHSFTEFLSFFIPLPYKVTFLIKEVNKNRVTSCAYN